MWVRGCPIKNACLTLQTSRNPGSSSGGGPWWLRAATKVFAPMATPGGARRPRPGEYKSKKMSKEGWTMQSLSFQILGYRHNRALLKDMRNMYLYFGQWDSFNVLSLSWLHRAAGFFQCPFIVMVSQGGGILSMSFQNSLAWLHRERDSFNVRHCHGFTGHGGSFNVSSLSWLHRAVGFFQCLSLSWFHRAMGF